MDRIDFIEKISNAFLVNPIVALLGPRQCGKTTLARQYAGTDFPIENYFDLESLADLSRLANPELALSQLTGLVVIDEIQRIPNLFQTLRVLVDRKSHPVKFLILGSASRELLQQSAESLTGRISYLELTPFNLTETHQMDLLWLRGGFPKSFLAENDTVSNSWRKEYIRTFLEQDIPNLGIRIPPQNLQRFWLMLAHYHGNIFNASEIGGSLGLSYNTMRNYADILLQTFMLRELQPWHENISKRQVKSPKIYFRDSGIFHSLLGIKSFSDLQTNPKLGASWEGIAIEEIIRYLNADTRECFFWSTHTGAELDLLIFQDGKKSGFEIKYTDSPKITRSMRIALEDLKLESITIIYPGKKDFMLDNNIFVVGLQNFLR